MSKWIRTKLDNVANLVNKKPAYFSGETPYLATSGVNGFHILPSEHVTYLTRPSRADIVIEPGDVLQAKMKETNKTVLVNEDMKGWLVSTGFAQFKPMLVGTNSNFLYHFLSSDNFLKEKDRLCVGSTQQAISDKDLRSIIIDIPQEVKVQEYIANIISVLNFAIEKTEALIEKYQNIKTGLMHDLFTRGLRTDGNLRPPREEAPELYQETTFGWIPKEWEIGGIEDYLIQPGGLKPGPFGSSLTKADYVESGYRVYGQEQVLAQSLAEGDYYVSSRKWLELSDFRVAKDDLLMTLVGVGTVGKILVVEEPFEEGLINPRLMRIRPDRSKCCTEFLANLIPSSLVRRQFNQYAGGGTMPVLNGSIVRKVRIPLVPKIEQERIAIRIASATVALKSELNYLQKLMQVKKGLMQDLLTGKVQVKLDETKLANAL